MTAVDIEPQNSECGTGAAKESSLRGLRHLERDQWLDVTIGNFSCTKCTWTTGRIPFQVWMLITHTQVDQESMPRNPRISQWYG